MINKKLLLVVPFLILGCGTAPQLKQQTSLPNWYIQAPQNSAYLYGSGEGDSIQEAKNNALNQIASSLSVSISSNFQKDEGYSSGSNGSSFFKNVKNNVNAEVKKIDFSDVEIVHNKLISGKYYILVRINKEKLFNSTKEKFLILDNKIKEQLNLNSNNPYEILRNINKAIPTINQALAKANVLYALNSNFNLKAYSKKYSSYLTKKEQLLNKITISVSNPNNQFSQKLIELLNEKNYKIKTNSVVDIKISTKPRFTETYGMKIARVSVNLKVIANNKIVYSANMEVKGISNANSQALAKASNAFKQKLSEIGIEKILGIE